MRRRINSQTLVVQVGEWWNQLPGDVFNDLWKNRIANRLYHLEFDHKTFSKDLTPKDNRERISNLVRRHAFQKLLDELKVQSQKDIAELFETSQGRVSL